MNSKKIVLTALLAVVIASATGGGLYYYKRHQRPALTKGESAEAPAPAAGPDELSGFRIMYPVGGSLQMKERRLPRSSRQTGMAEALLEEYFRGPGNGAPGVVPREVKVLGIYRDASQMLYVDLSDELRRNFQGDALAEYLVLKGIYETLMTNIQDIQDVKVLVEGKEIESMGGHFYLKFPLKNTVSAEIKAVQGPGR